MTPEGSEIVRLTNELAEARCEIARLREAIKEWAELDGPDGADRVMSWPAYEKACDVLHQIAREGR